MNFYFLGWKKNILFINLDQFGKNIVGKYYFITSNFLDSY